MKQNYDFRFNPKELPDEQIEKHMDFDALLDQFNKEKPIEAKRVSISPWKIGGFAIAASILGFIFLGPFFKGNSGNNYDQNAMAFFDSRPFIDPPIENIQPSLHTQGVRSENGGRISFSRNGKINIPPAAFIDENGSEVSGAVQVKYRTIKTDNDLFLSGIPTHINTQGQRHYLNNEQLVEIYAESPTGKKLKLAPNKQLSIEFHSTSLQEDVNDLDVFKLNEGKKTWELVNKAQSSVLPSARPTAPINNNSSIRDIDQKYDRLVMELNQNHFDAKRNLETSFSFPSRPNKPVPRDAALEVFDFDLETDFPELKDYSNIRWQSSERNKIRFISSVEWEPNDVNIRQLGNNYYQMDFKNTEHSVSIKVQPVLSKQDYEVALSDYNQKMQKFETQKKEADRKLNQEKEILDKNFNEKLEELRLQKLEEKEQLHSSSQQQQSQTIVEKAIKNVFVIEELGIWSCGTLEEEKGDKTQLTLKDEQGNNYTNNVLYVAYLNQQVISKHFLGEFAEINIPKNEPIQIWLINIQGKIAIIYDEELRKTLGRNKKEITLSTIQEAINNPQDVYDILKIGKAM